MSPPLAPTPDDEPLIEVELPPADPEPLSDDPRTPLIVEELGPIRASERIAELDILRGFALLGMLLGATGLGALVVASPVGGVFTSLISFITAPTAGVILIIVGYELSFKKSLLRPVAITMVLRLAVMAVLLVVASFAIFSLTPFDKGLQLALMLIFALPAPFVIPLFADVGKDGEYISTTLSMDTLLAIVLFVAIAAYSRVA